MADLFTDVTTMALVKSLDAAGARQRVIANNIANAETPGFTRSEVEFESRLKDALESTERDEIKNKISEIQLEPELDVETPAGANGNNVIIDKEMAEMSKNALKYEAYVQLLNMKGRMLREAIKEGRG